MGTSYRTIDKQNYIPFEANKLIVGARLLFNIYAKSGGMYETVFEAGMEYTAVSRDHLIGRSLHTLYIEEGDKASFDTYLSQGFTEGKSIYDSPKAFKDYSFHKDQYHQIDRQMLFEGTEVPFSIFLMQNYTYRPVLNVAPGGSAKIDASLAETRGDLMILTTDIPKYNEYLSSILKSNMMDGKNSGKIKAIVIKENSKLIMKDLFDDPRSGEKIKQTQVMVDGMIESIMNHRDTIYDLLSIRGYDYYTYTHSVNVCVLSVGLGVATGMDILQIERLGLGAMLHDIGKSAIPVEILNKQGKLDDREFKIVQGHVLEGEKILLENHRLSPEALLAVTQHHEKLSGKGYPMRLTDNSISLMGRITSIADCYDALTTTRPYKSSLSPFAALEIISKETGNYDPQLLKVFITMLGKIK
jgi:HD-GYP domain-containing protein (c-di-GMP phosphodiesterase class II)